MGSMSMSYIDYINIMYKLLQNYINIFSIKFFYSQNTNFLSVWSFVSLFIKSNILIIHLSLSQNILAQVQ